MAGILYCCTRYSLHVQIITEFNKDKKSRKYHLENKTALLKRMIEIDMVPQILLERKDLLQIYIPLFRNCMYNKYPSTCVCSTGNDNLVITLF